MKKFLALFLALLMVATMIAMTACEPESEGDDTKGGDTEAPAGDTTAPADDNKETEPADNGDNNGDDNGDDGASTAAYDAMAVGDNLCLLPEDIVDFGVEHCAGWESVYGMIDGLTPEKSFAATVGSAAEIPAYGDWTGDAQGNEMIFTIVWQHEVKFDGVGFFFWSDKAEDRESARDAYLAGGGTDFPAYYTIQYLNADGEFVDVSNQSGSPVEQDVMNKVTFDAVTTTEIQITMYKLSDEEIESIGDISEDGFGGYGTGIFEFEVYKAA